MIVLDYWDFIEGSSQIRLILTLSLNYTVQVHQAYTVIL